MYRADDIPVAYGVPMPPPSPFRVAEPQAPAHNDHNHHHQNHNHNATATAMPITDAARRSLKEQGYTNGLIESLQLNKLAFPLRIWVVDNSGSMKTEDGHRIVALTDRQHMGHYEMKHCTRWREMQETVDYHSQMAALLHAPTTFRLLNPPGTLAGPQTFHVCHHDHEHHHHNDLDHEVAVAHSVMMNTQPSGFTPLARHIQEIRTDILTDPSLQRLLDGTGAKVAIVLATDGLPTDAYGYANSSARQQFVDALRSLVGLPVWIVVRLCTDEDDVVRFWNDLDQEVELSLEVLDDFAAEAKEVYEFNPWLNYCLPLHRMREMGFWSKVMDDLDEHPLSKTQLKDFMKILFGAAAVIEMLPDPEDDWPKFCDRVAMLVQNEKKQWNPLSKRLEPLIDIKQLKRKYGPRGLFGMW
jgi:hypothetical protein